MSNFARALRTTGRIHSRALRHFSTTIRVHQTHVSDGPVKNATLRSALDERQVIFSGIQPTGIPHLGNYLGAIRNWVDLQNESVPNRKLWFCVVDLHALTHSQSPSELTENTRATFSSLLACGINPSKSTLFIQSHVSAHSELYWLFSTFASMGYLSRMTQWKSKLGLDTSNTKSTAVAGIENLSEKERESLKLGLFSYPVLQAADIALYSTTHVPVGEDQVQHVEFTRQLIRTFNSKYSLTSSETAKESLTSNGLSTKAHLPLPTAQVSPAKRIMSLQNPSKKMSKSDPDPRSMILVTDPDHIIQTKIRGAKTDSIPGPITYDPVERPGVSNLLDILRYTTRSNLPVEEFVKSWQGESMNLGKLKKAVGDALVEELGPIRDRYARISENANLHLHMIGGARVASQIAGLNLGRIRDAMGLL